MADPGFPRGGGANSPGGRQHTNLPNFPKNCMKLKIWMPGGGGRPSWPPLESALHNVSYALNCQTNLTYYWNNTDGTSQLGIWRIIHRYINFLMVDVCFYVLLRPHPLSPWFLEMYVWYERVYQRGAVVWWSDGLSSGRGWTGSGGGVRPHETKPWVPPEPVTDEDFSCILMDKVSMTHHDTLKPRWNRRDRCVVM